MPAEARISPVWKKQKLFVSLFFLAVAGWFFLDGGYVYPRSNVRWQAHDLHKREGRLAEWPGYAKSQGWVEKAPEKFHKPEDIAAQFIFGGVTALIGSLLLAYWFTQKGRILRSDEEAVYTPAGTRVPFAAITGVGKKRWESKGIAKVRYALNGRKGEFLVDDYKFETEPSRKVLAEIEERLLTRAGATKPAAPEASTPSG